jgi:rhodanese-related sulfurtransferase
MCVGQQVHDLTPQDVAKGMAEGRYLLVDVREPNEVAVDGYPGAVNVPLSSFDANNIPDPQGKTVVFACRSGKRSVTASLAAQGAGLAYDSHLAGGMLAWKAAGLPTFRSRFSRPCRSSRATTTPSISARAFPTIPGLRTSAARQPMPSWTATTNTRR